ncbi:MAG: tetratricopeptide repeat protein [Acidobacteria bacterium]|nr:tetratricopeptide repeat protein [Acidobacteriota bacterium]
MYKQSIRLLTLAVLFSLSGPIARAANTLKCTVTQQDGLPAEKVELILTGSASDKQWKKKTNDKGEVEFKGLPDGTYRMEGADETMQAFLLTKASDIELSGNTTKTCAPVFVSINVLNQLLTDANEAARTGKPDLAIEKGKAAEAMAPNIPNTHIVLAVGYAKKGMVEEALAAARRAAELDPDRFGQMEKAVHMEALGTQASELLAKQDFDAAIAKYQEIIAVAPDEGTVYYNLALAYGHKGDFDNAIQTIDKAIQLAPNDLEFKQRKVQLQDLYLKSTEKSLELNK